MSEQRSYEVVMNYTERGRQKKIRAVVRAGSKGSALRAALKHASYVKPVAYRNVYQVIVPEPNA